MKKNNKGFSLVELIVVIAIMAILAAIAIPTFAHFINKANEAADDQLLHDINYIFQAACLENGLDVSDITAATWDMETMLVISVNGDANHPVVKSFKSHFDLTGEEFNDKEITALYFDAGKHAFVPNTVSSMTITYGGATIDISPTDVAKLKDSTFGKMGMGTLLGELDKVSGIAAGLDSELMNGIISSNDFKKNAAIALGVDINAGDWETQLENKYTKLLEDYFASQNPPKTLQEATPEEIEQARAKIDANATILYTANQTSQVMNRDEITSFLNDPNKQIIIDNMDPEKNTNTSEGLAQAALICGLYTSYVNSTHGEGLTEEQKQVNVANVLNALDTDQNFKNYLKSDQGIKDTDAYLSSLNMISSSTQNPDAVSQLMINGFGDPELVGALDSSLGK